MEKHGKVMGKSWEYHGNSWKSMKNHGKTWEYHGILWKITEKHGKNPGTSIDGSLLMESQPAHFHISAGSVHCGHCQSKQQVSYQKTGDINYTSANTVPKSVHTAEKIQKILGIPTAMYL